MARDNYKQLCGGNEANMHEDLVFRFIEAQALILSPICPHICERIWQLIEKVRHVCFFTHFLSVCLQDGLIVNARWPDTLAVDEDLVKKNDFIHRVVREFRLRREALLNPKKKDPSKKIHPPVEATIFIADRYPQWKIDIMEAIKELYLVCVVFLFLLQKKYFFRKTATNFRRIVQFPRKLESMERMRCRLCKQSAKNLKRIRKRFEPNFR